MSISLFQKFSREARRYQEWRLESGVACLELATHEAFVVDPWEY